MKKLYTIGLALCLGVAGVSAANVRTAKAPARTAPVEKKAPAQVFFSESDVYKSTVFVKEDFANFKNGTPEEPAEGYIEDEIGWIDESYTPTSGHWSGVYVREAGGAAFVDYVDNYPGTLSTPDLNMPNATTPVTITFRARSQKDEDYQKWVYLSLVDITGTTPLYVQDEYGKIYADWTEHSYTFDKPRQEGHKYLIQIYGYDNELVVDDVEVKFLVPYIGAPKATGFSDFTADSFKVKWDAVKGADGYLVSLFTLNKDRDKTRDYIVENLEVAGTEHLFSGLETVGKSFYYVVRAKKGDKVSPESNRVRVEALTVPENLTAVRTDEGVKLSWDAVPETWYYEVIASREHTAAADEEFVVARENFDNFDWEGTVDNPGRDLDDQYVFDETKGMSGWISEYPVTIKGGFGLDGVICSNYNGDVYLQSPFYDLTPSEGKLNMKADMLIVDEESGASYKPYVQIMNYSAADNRLTRASMQDIKGLSDEWSTAHASLTGGTSSCVFEICARGGLVFVDNIELTMPLKAGVKATVPYLETKTEEPSIVIPVSELLEGETLGYTIRAVKEVWDDYGYSRDYSVYSLYTPYSTLDLRQDGVESVVTDSAAAGSNDVYNLQGICVLRDATAEQIKALPAGLYIAGGRKIAVK